MRKALKEFKKGDSVRGGVEAAENENPMTLADTSRALLSVTANAVKKPEGGPLNVILLAAPKLDQVDIVTCLSSIAHHSPDSIVLLIVNPEQADSLKGMFSQPVESVDVPQDPSSQTSWRALPSLRLWIRMYSWPALDSRLSPQQRAYMPPIRRYAMYPHLLDDMESGGSNKAEVDEAASSPILLFSNLPPTMIRAPTGVFISDSRDMVFQADPFPRFWGMLEGDGISGADEVALVVAGEAKVTTIGKDDWNRGWVSFCYYDLGEAMVQNEQIYCSGTTFGTLAGIRYYITQGMLPAMEFCSVIDWEKGMDQGIHNVLLHRYSDRQITEWKEMADEGGPFRPGGGKYPIMKHPKEFLDMVRDFQRGIKIHVTNAEEGDICTMALLLISGTFQDGEGRVLPASGKAPCAVVHQFDRAPPLVDYFRRKFAE